MDTEVSLGTSEGMPRDGVASLDDLTTIPMAVLDERITTLSSAKLTQIEAAIRLALGMRR
jgi:mRNA-degrading endonuclease toxin of MazEF toxin-antitoxin module